MRREAIFGKQGWYPDQAGSANEQLELCLKADEAPSPALAVISPHAGWAFSGATAGRLYAGLEVPGRVLVLCPMHRATGERVALWPSGEWETPIGDMAVDEEFGEQLKNNCSLVQDDFEGHLLEHAIEIQLPFIKARNAESCIVPIRLGHLSDKECLLFAQGLQKTIEAADGPTLIVASSDMSHESDYERVKKNDALAKEKILAMDAQGLLDTVEQHSITMCGYLPATVAIMTARLLGATSAVEVAYTTSADVSGRFDYVVGYLAVRLDR